METKKDLVVVKVGTNVLTRQDSYDWPTLDEYYFHSIGRQINKLADAGMATALVSSAAIIAGHEYTHEERIYERTNPAARQRMACLGQATLMMAWQQALRPRSAGQLLFTGSEIDDGEGAELSAVARNLIEAGDIPVANENDALSHEEITFGDNDTLAARFAVLLKDSGAFRNTRLVVLSDVHGVYSDIEDKTSVVPLIDDIDDSRHFLADGDSGVGTGGMVGKFDAAGIANASGIEMNLGHGRTSEAIEKLLCGEIGTRFMDEGVALA